MKLEEYREECLNIGLSTQPIKRDFSQRKEIDYIYKKYLNLDPPEIIWYVDSPLQFIYVINLLYVLEGKISEDKLMKKLKKHLKDEKKRLFYNVWWGNCDISWLGFYTFPVSLGIKYTDEEVETLEIMKSLVEKIGFVWYFKGICFICDRPILISKKGVRLHNEKDMALKYKDGYGLWYLNGVEVPSKIVTTPAAELDAKLILKEKNAEVRREIVRKIGIDKVCHDLGSKSIDKKGDYELLLLDMGDGRKRPYLKMKNPSLEGVYHVEGVPPNCLTVDAALEYRNGGKESPDVLT